jgi:predicted nucleic acid-binding Zn ribbon protein
MTKTCRTKPDAPKQKDTLKAGTKSTALARTMPASKSTALIALLRRPSGATLDEMMQATGWQKHSVRGFMAGALKKQHGLTVSSEKSDRGRVYRLSNAAVQ